MKRRAAVAVLALAFGAGTVTLSSAVSATGPNRPAAGQQPATATAAPSTSATATSATATATPATVTSATATPGATGASAPGTDELLTPTGPAASTRGGTRQTIDLDEDLLRPGRDVTVRLNLAPGRSPTATLRTASTVGDGYQHWTGRLAGAPDSLVTVVRRGASVSGLVSTRDGNYTITTTDAGEQVLTAVDPDAPDHDLPLMPPGADQASGPAGSPSAPPADAVPADALPADAVPADALPAADSNPVVDVLVGYTPQAATAAGGVSAVQALAAASIAVSNDSFAASGVNLTFRLVGTTQVSGGSVDASSTTLSQITSPSDGSYDSLHATRSAVGADLVSLLVDGGPYCGIAWYPGGAYYGFSVVAQGCAVGNLTFPHELGHNLGAAHDRYVTSSEDAYYPYGFGLVNLPGGWRTIMAYANQCSAAAVSCPRIARWSNPTQTWLGSPLGFAAGLSNAADNRTALNTTAATVAGYVAESSVQMTAPGRTYTLGTSITAAWSVPDGTANVDVRYQRAIYNGGFTAAVYPASWQRTTGTRVVLPYAAQGATYCFSARARDGAGNVSAWSAPRCTAVALDDRSVWATSGWTRITGSAYYARTATITTSQGATLTRTNVQAKRLYLVATRCASCGTVGVYWNGTLLKRINLYAAVSTPQSVLGITTFTGVRSGTLTVRPLTSGKRIQVDGVVLSRS